MHEVVETGKYVPRGGVWEITLACNMRCLHCGSHAGAPRPDELTTAEALRLVEELAALGCRRLVLSGGEPTLRRDWPRIVETGTRLGIAMKMITNGRLFDEALAETARSAGLDSIGVSLDGLEASHDHVRNVAGAYRGALGAIRAARTVGLPVAAVTHVNRRNRAELDALHDLLSAEGVFAWQVQLGNPSGELGRHPELVLEPRDLLWIVPEIARLVERGPLRVVPADNIGYYGPHERVLRTHSSAGSPCFRGCLGGRSHFGIESNGNVKGCLSLPSSRHGRDGTVEGNVRETSFEEIWRRPGAFAYSRAFEPSDLGGFCATCRHAAACRGGCRWSMVALGGGRENPYCHHRVLAEESVRRFRSPRRRIAAAVVAAPFVLGTAACYGTDDPEEDVADVSEDAGDEATPADAYGFPDTAYGFPDDADVPLPSDAYGIPDDAADAADDAEAEADDLYGIPDAAYAMPEDDRK
jgi:radical SAM protein with 4Fe4S-binding SPASM domain